MRATFSEFEKWRSKIAWGYLLLFKQSGLSRKWCYTHAYKVSSPCVVPLASLRSEEVILKKSAWGLWLSWKRCNKHAHQVSPPCVLQLTSLRSEEDCLRLFQTICGRYGNMYGNMYNRHTYQVLSLCVLPLESLRSEEVKVSQAICCCLQQKKMNRT